MQAPRGKGDGSPPAKVPRRSCSPAQQQEGPTGGGATSAPEERRTVEAEPQSMEVAAGSEGQPSTITQSPRGSLPVVEGQQQQASSAQEGHQHFLEFTLDLPFLPFMDSQLSNQYFDLITRMHQDNVHLQYSLSGSKLQVRIHSYDKNNLRVSAMTILYHLDNLMDIIERLLYTTQGRPPSGRKA